MSEKKRKEKRKKKNTTTLCSNQESFERRYFLVLLSPFPILFGNRKDFLSSRPFLLILIGLKLGGLDKLKQGVLLCPLSCEVDGSA